MHVCMNIYKNIHNHMYVYNMCIYHALGRAFRPCDCIANVDAVPEKTFKLNALDGRIEAWVSHSLYLELGCGIAM